MQTVKMFSVGNRCSPCVAQGKKHVSHKGHEKVYLDSQSPTVSLSPQSPGLFLGRWGPSSCTSMGVNICLQWNVFASEVHSEVHTRSTLVA